MPAPVVEGYPVPQAQNKAPKRVAVSSHRTFVLDTSVLLADPGALKRFAEHEVVLPVVVISELEGKRHHPELGFFARTALRQPRQADESQRFVQVLIRIAGACCSPCLVLRAEPPA